MLAQSANGTRLPLGFAALCLLTAGCQPATSPTDENPHGTAPAAAIELITPDGLAEGEAVIDAEYLKEQITQLSADTMEGRAPGTAGDALAQQHLVSEMQAIGLQPAADDGFIQPFDIVGLTATVPSSWSFDTDNGEVTLSEGSEFVAFSGVQTESATINDAELVFVGYGIDAPEYGWDDWKGVDVAGKVVVMMNNDPEWDDDLFEGERRLYYGRWTYKYESAASHGAAGAIVIHTTPSAGYPWQVVESSWTGEQVELPAGQEPRIQVGAWTTEDAMRRLLNQAGHDLDALRESARTREFAPVPLGITTSLSLTTTVNRTQTANVLGALPGSDPELADEWVVYSAHFDHLGASGPGEDKIYNGALDNATGTAVVLQIAKALAALPTAPRRSVLFAFVGAEESGLLGSKFFAEHPTIHPGKMAANLNFDGGNIWGPTTDVTYIGYGKSSLDRVVEAAAALQGREVKPDQFPDRGFFYRSDQFNFAKIGVPAIYLDNGTSFRDRPEGWGKEQIEAWEAEHYHQPSDEIRDDWNYDGMLEDVLLGLRAGLHIANTAEMPAWNAGDEFEAARLEALAAAP